MAVAGGGAGGGGLAGVLQPGRRGALRLRYPQAVADDVGGEPVEFGDDDGQRRVLADEVGGAAVVVDEDDGLVGGHGVLGDESEDAVCI
jgi:hypothetical protein